MNDTFHCGDSGALVAYLYDECEPGERELIAAHITRCVTCASEIDALSATRQTLATWTPPELALGFQITRTSDAQTARALVPKIAWWRAPMPAWAQIAAAALIFAAGLSVGLGSPGQAPAPQAASVSQDELAQVEQRIKAEVKRLQTATTTTATPVAARGSDEALLQQVKALIEESAAEQRRDFTVRIVDLGYAVEQARREDRRDIAYYGGQVQGATDQIRQQQGALYEWLRQQASQTSR